MEEQVSQWWKLILKTCTCDTVNWVPFKSLRTKYLHWTDLDDAKRMSCLNIAILGVLGISIVTITTSAMILEGSIENLEPIIDTLLLPRSGFS